MSGRDYTDSIQLDLEIQSGIAHTQANKKPRRDARDALQPSNAGQEQIWSPFSSCNENAHSRKRKVINLKGRIPCLVPPTTRPPWLRGGYIVLSLPWPTRAACLRQVFAQKTCINSVGLVFMLVDKGNAVRSARHPGRLVTWYLVFRCLPHRDVQSRIAMLICKRKKQKKCRVLVLAVDSVGRAGCN